MPNGAIGGALATANDRNCPTDPPYNAEEAMQAATRIQRHWRSTFVRLRLLCAGRGQVAWLDGRLSRVLHPHQRLGVRWLYRIIADNHRRRAGAILADDPGLGKSLQTISLLDAVIHYTSVKRVLIAAPANLITTWRNEFKKWAQKRLSVDAISEDIASLSVGERQGQGLVSWLFYKWPVAQPHIHTLL